ncbi:MAG: hypothetical protein HKN48_08880 [Flavobacteriaceae bacterium]|nr:hypothetical protein [Flavobacteriaceae bacterium]
MSSEGIIKFHGKQSIGMSLLAAILFTASIICGLRTLDSLGIIQGDVSSGELFLWGFITYITFRFAKDLGIVHDYEFDFYKRRYKVIKCLGPFKYGKWKYFDDLKSISVNKSTGKTYKVVFHFKRFGKKMVVKFKDQSSANAFARKAKQHLNDLVINK